MVGVRLLVGVVAVVAAAAASSSCGTGQSCEDAVECSDGLFCNGEELCIANECYVVSPVRCDDGVECTIDRCNEVTDRCESSPPDRDGDGVGDASCLAANGDPLGGDCDDGDARRFTGNRETCDAEDLDEDCDPTTFGSDDADRDGLVSVGCCNRTNEGRLLCGNDCDDTNPAIVHGSQVCEGEQSDVTLVCQVDGTYRRANCSIQRVCVPQPNGTGVCI